MFLFRYKTPEDKKLARYIRSQFGFSPKNISLFKQAFLHKSTLRDTASAIEKSNERLEFLGDAVLDIVMADFLYKKFPNEHEGFLTQMRSKVVKRETLNRLGETFKMDEWVKYNQYGDNNPKALLGNTFEAVMGAIYLDCGFEKAQKIILEKVVRPHLDMEQIRQQDTDYKSRIIIWCQREKKKIDFLLVKEEMNGTEMKYEIHLAIDGEVKSKGMAKTKKEAEQLAARQALEKISE